MSIDSDSKEKRKEEFDEIHVAPASESDGSSVREHRVFGSTSAEHRKLESYHVNLIAIGGTIGTALFVYMGEGLTGGGPASLLLGYAFWVSVVWAVAEGQREMVVYWPTDAAFSRNASRYIDPAIGFATAFNFWISQVALVMFECTAFSVVIGYWASAAKVNDAVYISITLVAYFLLNIWDARFFADTEFILAMGKIVLITGLIFMTFVVMVGGNPLHDAFGFRFWKTPGAFAVPSYANTHPRGTGLFEGFVACVINACFTVAGPDYLSMVAGEARNPRKTMATAFKATVYRLVIFFLGSAICIGVLCPYDDPNLLGAQASGTTGAGASPYVIGMNRLNIKVLPHIVNALILSAVFSAGNAFQFCASRTMAQMSVDGQAPKFLSKRNRNGVPYYSVIFSLSIALLAYCQVSSTASVVITWLSGLVGSAQLVNWCVLSFTWIRWNAGLKAQGISRDTLQARSIFQPYAAWYAFFCAFVVMLIQGYTVFLKNNWSGPSFAFAYAMPLVFIALSIGWKVIFRSKFQTASKMDLVSFINDPEFDPMEYDAPRGGNFSRRAEKVLKMLF